MPRNPAKEAALSHAALTEQLAYDPVTGVFTWRHGGSRRVAGKRAGFVDTFGYRKIGVIGHVYFEHRLAWFYVNGRWPADEIDHIDRNISDNRIANLRECTKRQNIANRRGFRNSKSRLKGAAYIKKSGYWRATITIEGRHVCLGEFKTPEQAHSVYMQEARRVHGEFASC